MIYREVINMNKNLRLVIIFLLIAVTVGCAVRFREPILDALTPVAEFSARLVTGQLW